MNWYLVFANCIVIAAITCIFIIFDIITGFAGGVKEKDVNSTIMRDGLWHKSGFFGLMIFAYLIEVASLYAELGFEVPSVTAVCIYIILTECVSIFENLCILNPEIANSPLGKIFKNTPRIEKAEDIESEEN